jgi:hypothetical protein
MENVKELWPKTKQSAELAVINEALELLHEAKRYRGIFYKQRVAELEVKIKKLQLVITKQPQ